jgi:hypothetical protein
MTKTKSGGRRRKNRSRKGKGKGKLDIVKLINLLEKALSNVREGESIYKESNGKELINKLYNDLAKLTKSKGSKNKLIKKLRIICQKMYNIVRSSIHPNLLQNLNIFATKKNTEGPTFKILKGGMWIPGLSEAAAAFVIKQTGIAIATAATYVMVKTVMAYSVQYEATENIKKQTKEATDKVKKGVDEQLRRAGFGDEDITRYSTEIKDRLDLPAAMREVECQDNGGTMRQDGERRRCLCDPKKLIEGTNCHTIVTGAQDPYEELPIRGEGDPSFPHFFDKFNNLPPESHWDFPNDQPNVGEPDVGDMQQLQVIVPNNASPGMIMQVQAPNGKLLQVQVPQNAKPGSSFMINIPVATAADASALVNYGPPVPDRIKSRLFLEEAERNLRARALPSGVSSVNAIPKGELVIEGHEFSARDLVELDNAIQSSGESVNLPSHIKDKLIDNIRSTQVSNWEDVFIEIELGDGLSLTPTVIMRMLNNFEISIRKISAEIASEAMGDIVKRIERVTSVGTGGTTYGWLTFLTGTKQKKRTGKMVEAWKRQKKSIKEEIKVRKAMIKHIYNDLVRAFEDIIATFESASEDVQKLLGDAKWGVLTLGATVLAKEGLLIAILNEMNNQRLGPNEVANTQMLELMDGLGKKKKKKKKKTKKRKGGKRNKITRRQFK